MSTDAKKWKQNVKKVAKENGYDLDHFSKKSYVVGRLTDEVWSETYCRLQEEYYAKEEKRLGKLPSLDAQDEHHFEVLYGLRDGSVKPTKEDFLKAAKDIEYRYGPYSEWNPEDKVYRPK